MQTSQETTNFGKVDKLIRYGWRLQDSPGVFMQISKHDLRIPEEYQREIVDAKVKEICSAWSWFGCGVLIVALRGHNFWVVDGQHRAKAAMSRSDIQSLPCMVFETDDVVEEAKAFLTLNTGRKSVTAIGKLKALAVSDDENAKFIVNAIHSAGLSIVKTAIVGGQIKCISVCQRLASEDKDTFIRALALCAELSFESDLPILERVLSSIYYIDKHTFEGISDKRMRAKLKSIKIHGIYVAASKAAAYYATGGMKVWADGVLSAVNKGVQNKFEFVK